MIGQIWTGSGFAGLARYLTQGNAQTSEVAERLAWWAERNLAAAERVEDVPGLMRATAQMSERVERPVLHLALSLPPGEALSREQWEVVVDRTLRDLDLHEHQALLVAHKDKAHEHVHVMVNRVHPETGKVWSDWQSKTRLAHSLADREREFQLQRLPHDMVRAEDRIPDQARAAWVHRDVPAFVERARVTARPILQEAKSWSEVHERLRGEAGMTLERKGQGLVLTDGPQGCKASSLGREFSKTALERRLGSYEPGPAFEQAVVAAIGRRRDLDASVRMRREVEAQVEAARHALSDASRPREGPRNQVMRTAEQAGLAPRYAQEAIAFIERGGDPAHAVQRKNWLSNSHAYHPKLDRAVREFHQAFVASQPEVEAAKATLEIVSQRHEQASLTARQLVSRHDNLPSFEAAMEWAKRLTPGELERVDRATGLRPAVVECAGRRVVEVRAQAWTQPTPAMQRLMTRHLKARGASPAAEALSLYQRSKWMVFTIQRGISPAKVAQLAMSGMTGGGFRALQQALAILHARMNPGQAIARVALRAIGLPTGPVALVIRLVRDLDRGRGR